MLRHIAWFNQASIEPNPKGGLRSADERVCRRCLQPAVALEDRGVACSVFGNLQDADPAEVGKLLQKLNTDIVIIGAFTDPSLLKLAKTAKHLGCYIVGDFADQAAISKDFEKLAAIADHLIVGDEAARACLQRGGLHATIIADADTDAWLACLNALKLKPPLCANTNTPPAIHGDNV